MQEWNISAFGFCFCFFSLFLFTDLDGAGVEWGVVVGVLKRVVVPAQDRWGGSRGSCV